MIISRGVISLNTEPSSLSFLTRLAKKPLARLRARGEALDRSWPITASRRLVAQEVVEVGQRRRLAPGPSVACRWAIPATSSSRAALSQNGSFSLLPVLAIQASAKSVVRELVGAVGQRVVAQARRAARGS